MYETIALFHKLPKGVILQSKFDGCKARYIFLDYNQVTKQVTVMPFRKERKLDPCKVWKTNSRHLFTVADESEQFDFAWERFNMGKYLQFINTRLNVSA